MEKLKSPLSVEFCITHRCNHRCIHCYDWRSASSTDSEQTVLICLQKIIDNHVQSLTITGGEPLTNPELVYKIINKCIEASVEVSLNTNATLLSESIARTLSGMDWSKHLLISLPAFDPAVCDQTTGVVGSFDNIIRGIEVAKSCGLIVTTNTVVTRRNVSKLNCYKDVFDRILPDSIALTPVAPYGEDASILLRGSDYDVMRNIAASIEDAYAVEVRSLNPVPFCHVSEPMKCSRCTAAITSCSVDGSNGNVCACPHMNKSYGNLLENDLSTIWNRMDDWRNDRYLDSTCLKCPELESCGGLCRMYKVFDVESDVKIIDHSGVIKNTRSGLTETDSFKIKNYVVRDEGGFYTVMTADGTIFINKTGVLLLETMKNLGTFNVETLSKYVEFNDALEETLIALLNKGIIESVK